MEDFIKIYKNALSDDICDYIIKLINDNGEKLREGRTIHGVNKNHKSSRDLNLLEREQEYELDNDARVFLDTNVLPVMKNIIEKSLLEYNKEHSVVTRSSDENDEEFKKRIEASTIIDPNSILCKKYNKNEGFFNWHKDNGDGWGPASRILVLMFYLNDVEEGGETEFYYQEVSIKPKKGSLVIFPTDWMHLHRGKMPISNDKYICNLWLLRRNPIVNEMADDPAFKDHFMNKK